MSLSLSLLGGVAEQGSQAQSRNQLRGILARILKHGCPLQQVGAELAIAQSIVIFEGGAVNTSSAAASSKESKKACSCAEWLPNKGTVPSV